jgi:hypothetical protein
MSQKEKYSLLRDKALRLKALGWVNWGSGMAVIATVALTTVPTTTFIGGLAVGAACIGVGAKSLNAADKVNDDTTFTKIPVRK